MSFYETPRRNASDSTSSTRSMNRGHRREHSDPCPLPSPGLPHKALSMFQAVRKNIFGKGIGNRHLFYGKGIIHDA